MKHVLIICLVLVIPAYSLAQEASRSEAQSSLPSAPAPQQAQLRTASAPMAGLQASAPQTTAVPSTSLSLREAQALALKNNPQISFARLTALATQQVTRQVRSNLWPTATMDLTAVDSEPGSRITAGALNNPTVYPRAAAGATVTQLITDFGRTTNLISSASLAAKAENQNALATKEQILLAVDQAFYNALQTHAVLTVAQQTVNDRQTVSDQVGALFKSKLKSELDLSFANVNLAQAKLLLLDAQNNENAALAALSAVLGFSSLQSFQLVEDPSSNVAPPGNVDELISTALTVRPEILALDFQSESAAKFQKAERDLLFPNIRALGTVGDTPVRNPAISPNWYGAVGVNVDIPVFNGFLFTARAREASLREQATRERLRDLRDRISRDVRTSWLNANTAYQRLAVTQQLLDQANLALNLAEARYHLGLGSIVELSQGQLQQTQAQISNAQAMYDYRLSLAVLQYQTSGI
ncbi:MAG TPA: TolC family protein [Candidatus Polarisedimenticolia bacterium]|nr:TolC family protein [Candidatus Polarisedimenticolia bacterium]